MNKGEKLEHQLATIIGQEEKGVFFVVAEAGNKYLSSSAFDDIVEIQTTLKELGKVSITFIYDCFNKTNHRKICSGYTRLGVVDKNGKIAKIPPDIINALKAEVAELADAHDSKS